jgi:Beta-propeller repeat
MTATTSATATTGSTGGAGECMPQAQAPCYDGPPGTEGVGICKAGIKTCNADGMTYGPCMGEIVPQPEDCATPIDEDCDGLAPSCKGTCLWSIRAGDANAQDGSGIAVDASGNVLVTGSFSGTMTFGGAILTSAGADDAFVAKLDALGNPLWSKRFGDLNEQIGAGIAADASGDALVTGTFAGVTSFGGSLLASAGLGDVFVVKLDAAGNHVWSKRFGDAGEQDGNSVAVDAVGNVLVTGFFFGAMNFGGGPLVSAGQNDIFVVKLDDAGNHLWSKRFGDAGAQSGASIAVDAAGNVLVTGSLSGTVDFGGGPLVSAGQNDIFVVKLDAAGNHLWSRRFGDGGAQGGAGIAADGLGNVLVTGAFSGTANFGGGPLASAGGGDVFVVKLDGAGNHVWSKRFGDSNEQAGYSVAVDAAGNVFVTGSFSGAVDFGGGQLASAGSDDFFLLKLDAVGSHLWSRRAGAQGADVGQSVKADSAGNALVTGTISGTADFGAGPLTSPGGGDIFIAKFAP